MGEVYRAKDPRLGREVAIKVLPASFSSDADRLRRFEQEARAAGILNHPNITAVYDIGTHENAPYVVQELLEGETLRSVLAGGRLQPRKATDYSLQIAHGLAAAHEKGIVHRDLKPENLFVTKDGRVKILDFGLAKLTQKDAGPEASSLPTATAGTEPGVVMGTLGYMSPEQVRGKTADARSDIFSFGAILYEMLAGRRAFHGDSAADTMSAILREEPPDLSVTNQNIPPGLERIVRHCLEKNPEQRFHSAHDLAFDLDALTGVSGAAPVRAQAGGTRLRLSAAALAAAGVGVLALGMLAGRWLATRSASARPPTFHRLTFRRGNVLSARFAPDGKTVVYGAAWETSPAEIFVVRTDSTESRPLGLARADLLAVSSKGELAVTLKKVSLYDPTGMGTLARMPLGGGTPREVLEDVWQADWAPNGEDLAAVRRSPNGKALLEYPLGTALYESASILRPRVSPAGDRVAFVEFEYGPSSHASLKTVDRKGKPSTVSRGWTAIYGLAWSPRGDGLIVAGSRSQNDNAILEISLSGKERLLIGNGLGLLLHDVASDGRLLVERAAAQRGLRCLVRGENREKELGWLDRSGPRTMAPDGSAVLFGEYGEARGPRGGVYLRKTDGSPAVRLGDGNGLDLSSDGRWALALTPGPPAELVLLPTGAGATRKIPVEGVEPIFASFLPGEKGFFVVSAEKGEIHLFTVGPEGGKPKPVPAVGLGVDSGGALSPDGESILYKTRMGEIQIMPISGGPIRTVPGAHLGPLDFPMQWSAEGRFLYVQRGGQVPALVDRLELATGRVEQWKRIGPEDATGVIGIGSVRVTHDGQSYAYSYDRVVASDLYVVEGLSFP